MANQAIEVSGLKELGANLKEFPLKLEKKWLRKALKEGADIPKTEMERRARRQPRGPSHPDVGHLADNIVITSRLSEKKGAVVRVGPSKDAWWGGFQEFGTPHVPADPFMRPALDSNEATIIAIVAAILKGGVTIEAKKLAAKQKIKK